jgi:sigma-B regulation protein RsbU (phosphoserine phosphatase)
MSAFDDLVDDEAIAGLLALASAAAAGAAIGMTDGEGRVVAGRSPGVVPARVHPIAIEERVVGSLVGSDTVPPELLALVARSLELVLAGGRDQSERARVGNELAVGRRIQLSLMPRTFPELEGWTFASYYEPAREVSGDLFDAFQLRGQEDQVCLLIADVTGKGIPAALLMADVRALLHAAADSVDSPAEAVRRVNTILVRERATSLFVTAALLFVETATGIVRHASAGHEAPLVARYAGAIDRLEASGPILGAFDDAIYEERTARLLPGDALVLYTDGATETRSPSRSFYGEERLIANLTAACGRPADAIVHAIVDDIRAFRGEAEPFDDLTLLIVERRPASG